MRSNCTYVFSFRSIVLLVPPLVLFLQSPSSTLAQELPKITVGYSSRSISNFDFFAAEHLGYFKAEGLDVRLVQARASVALAALIGGDLDVFTSITSTISAIQRGAPLKIVFVGLYRPLFWLAVRPEFKVISDLKGKVVGVASIGGAQHTALSFMLRKGRVNPDKDVTTIVVADSIQLQALVSNTIQAAAMPIPAVVVARDRFKMNVLANVIEDYPTLQNGVSVTEKFLRERPGIIRALLRSKTKSKRLFHDNPQAAIDTISKVLNLDYETATQAYSLSKSAFTRNGIVPEHEAMEYVRSDAERLNLKEAVPFSRIFDFSIQIEVNRELGIK